MQNGFPPTQNVYNFKRMTLKDGVLPNNRLEPLTTPNLESIEPENSASIHNGMPPSSNFQNFNKIGLQADVFPRNGSILDARSRYMMPPPGNVVIDVQPSKRHDSADADPEV